LALVTGVLEFLDSVPGSVSGKLHRAELPLISLSFCQTRSDLILFIRS